MLVFPSSQGQHRVLLSVPTPAGAQKHSLQKLSWGHSLPSQRCRHAGQRRPRRGSAPGAATGNRRRPWPASIQGQPGFVRSAPSSVPRGTAGNKTKTTIVLCPPPVQRWYRPVSSLLQKRDLAAVENPPRRVWVRYTFTPSFPPPSPHTSLPSLRF